MKKLYPLLLTLLLLLATSCQRAELPNNTLPNGTTESITGPDFSAQVEVFADGQEPQEKAPDTRTSLLGNAVVWNEGDQLAVFQGASILDTYQVKDEYIGKDNGVFRIVAKGETGSAQTSFPANIAVYPYESDLTCTPVTDNNGATTAYQISNITLPTTQTYVANSFADDAFLMAAITNNTKDHTLNFKNLCGALKLQLKGTAKVKSIELRGNDNEPLAGDATVTIYPDGKTPTIALSSNASTTLILDCGDGVQLNETTATDFLFAIPPTAFEKGFTVTATTTEDKIGILHTSKPNSVMRSYVHSMPEQGIQTDEEMILENLKNKNTTALNNIRNAIQENDYVVEIAITKKDDVTCYFMTFNSSGEITFYLVSESQNGIPYTLEYGNRYSSGYVSDNRRVSILPYTIVVPPGVTIKPKDGYQWGWYTNVNPDNPLSCTLASGGWTTATYMGNGSAIGITIKKANNTSFDLSIESCYPMDYLEASDSSIWNHPDKALIFNKIDTSNPYFITIWLSDGSYLKVLTNKAIEDFENYFLVGKKISCIGDSITAGTGTTTTYWEILKELLGLDQVTALGVAGSCVSATSDYKTSNSPLINRYNSIPKSDIITIYMGTNDYGHETPLGSIDDNSDVSFYGALNVIIPSILSAHPEATLVWITPTHRYGFGTSKILGTNFTYDYLPNGRGHTLEDYVNAIKQICEKYSVPVIDLFNLCGIDPSLSETRTKYMPDGLHPNAAGHEWIADIIATHLIEIVSGV